MIGLLAVFGYIALNVAVIAVDGRIRCGSFGAWWNG